MCGICGIAHTDPERAVHADQLSRMNAALAHRGPDDAGVWTRGHVGLAMRRLSILDLPGGHQPMLNDDASVALVFNGEIYNYRELRATLEGAGQVFHTQSDTEVILRGYERYGEDVVQHLNGMFAIAIYDRARERLLLARDRLGIKPLFYTFRNGTLAFASELDALLRSGQVDGALNPAAVDAYFSFLYVPAPDTIFQHVHKLRPGEMLTFERGTTRVTQYWRTAFRPDPSWTLDSAADRYVELLTDAVRLQRVSDVPLGAFLSGGIDSSSVVGLLSLLSAKPVQTFTIGFDDAQADELAFARIAADHFGTDHTEEILKPDMLTMLPALAQSFGEPFADSSAVPTWLVSQVARQKVTVALSGDGGDELFAGYTWTHMNRKVNQYRSVPRPLRSLIDVALCILPRTPGIAKLRRFSTDSFLAPHESFRRRETCFSAELRAGLYSPEWTHRIGACAVDRFQEHADRAAAFSTDDAMLYQDLAMYLPDDILTKVDRMSMAHGLEARVPILDHRLVEFAGTVPFSLKCHGGVSKRLVKRALASLLPARLLRQRKQGFAIPIHKWFRGELQAHFAETVLTDTAHSRRFLSPNAARRLFNTHQSGRENLGHHLWTVLMFEHWLRYLETAFNVTPG